MTILPNYIYWIFLLLAIMAEVLGTSAMKYSEGFTKLIPSIFIFLCYGIGLAFLTITLKKIDLSVAYATWSGLGTALIVIIGVVKFNEPIGVMKILCIVAIISGVIGLKIISPE